MYNYYPAIVWSINIALSVIAVLTAIAIILCAVFKEHFWRKRRLELLDVKKNVFENVLAGNKPSDAVCQPFVTSITPQQFIDIETNRNIGIAFFNDSERQFFKNCFISPEQLDKLNKRAKGTGNKWRRIEAMLSLGYAQSETAVDSLKAMLSSKDLDIAYFAIVSLGQIKKSSSAKALLGFLLKDPSSGYKIVSILEGFPPDISDEVIKLTDYHDPMVRFWAITLLSRFSPSQYIKRIEKLTHDVSPEVRAGACDCLGNMKDGEVGTILSRCLRDDNWCVRQHAVIALAKIKGDKALPEVIGFINDGSWSVVDAVRDVMTGHIEASLPYIEKFLAGNDEVAKKYSVFALQDSGYLTKLLIDLVSERNKDTALRLLKGVLASKAHYGLDSALAGLDPGLRAKALEALIKIEEAK